MKFDLFENLYLLKVSDCADRLPPGRERQKRKERMLLFSSFLLSGTKQESVYDIFGKVAKKL